MLSLMAFIIVLRAKITSLTVAALWSCASAIQLVASTAAASPAHALATAIRRRRPDDLCLEPIMFHLPAEVVAISQIPQPRPTVRPRNQYKPSPTRNDAARSVKIGRGTPRRILTRR